MNRRFIILLLVLMFMYSGLKKLIKLGNTETKQFTNVYGLSKPVARFLVFSAGLLEVVASGIILWYEFSGTNSSTRNTIVNYAVSALIVFTILATLLFKIYPRVKMSPLLANLSVLAGLIMYKKNLLE